MFARFVQAQVDQVVVLVGEVPAAGGGLRGSVGELAPSNGHAGSNGLMS